MTKRILALILYLSIQSKLLAAFQVSRKLADPHNFILTTKVGNFAREEKRIISIVPTCTGPLFMSDDKDSETVIPLIGAAGLISQPIVWISLYFVKTTGAGLPSGPFGLVGGLEGLGYLAVLILAAAPVWRNVTGDGIDDDIVRSAEKLSILTLFVALMTLFSLIVDQGCIPNAKPILDYSAYFPVCNQE
jgi:hypothetical protein